MYKHVPFITVYMNEIKNEQSFAAKIKKAQHENHSLTIFKYTIGI